MAFGHILLGSHNFMVTAPRSCVKWPLDPPRCVNNNSDAIDYKILQILVAVTNYAKFMVSFCIIGSNVDGKIDPCHYEELATLLSWRAPLNRHPSPMIGENRR